MIKCYVDGAYSSLRNQGGWAFVVLKDDFKIHSEFFPEKDTTNNRMEIQAVIEACKWAKKYSVTELEIVSDSMYVIGTMTMEWKRKKNNDLWEIMDNVTKDLSITWTHVKGHSGDKYNELCDALAVEASKTIINE
jgi:ribonuclease HI